MNSASSSPPVNPYSIWWVKAGLLLIAAILGVAIIVGAKDTYNQVTYHRHLVADSFSENGTVTARYKKYTQDNNGRGYIHIITTYFIDYTYSVPITFRQSGAPTVTKNIPYTSHHVEVYGDEYAGYQVGGKINLTVDKADITRSLPTVLVRQFEPELGNNLRILVDIIGVSVSFHLALFITNKRWPRNFSVFMLFFILSNIIWFSLYAVLRAPFLHLLFK